MSVVPDLYDSAHAPHPAIREIRDLVRYRDLVRQLTSRNLRVRYKRSWLGVGWSMLSPLLTMLVLSIVFAQLFRTTAPDYPLYLFPGLLLWGFFAQTTSMIAAEVVGGIDLWRRVYTPRTAFAAAHALTGLIHLGLALVPLAGLMAYYGAPFGASLAIVPFIALTTAMFVLGVGLVVASWAGRFADVLDMFQVLLGTWMYLTPVIYPRSIVPARYEWLYALNPMTHFVELFRLPFYESRVPTASELGIPAALGVLTLAAGWLLFTRSADEFARRG